MAWEVYVSSRYYGAQAGGGSAAAAGCEEARLFLHFVDDVYTADDFSFFAYARHFLLTTLLRGYVPGEYAPLAELVVPREYWDSIITLAFPGAGSRDLGDLTDRLTEMSKVHNTTVTSSRAVTAFAFLDTLFVFRRELAGEGVHHREHRRILRSHAAEDAALLASPGPATFVVGEEVVVDEEETIIIRVESSSSQNASFARDQSFARGGSSAPRTPGGATQQHLSFSSAADTSHLLAGHAHASGFKLDPRAHKVEIRLSEALDQKELRIFKLEERLLEQAEARMRAEEQLSTAKEELAALRERYKTDLGSMVQLVETGGGGQGQRRAMTRPRSFSQSSFVSVDSEGVGGGGGGGAGGRADNSDDDDAHSRLERLHDLEDRVDELTTQLASARDDAETQRGLVAELEEVVIGYQAELKEQDEKIRDFTSQSDSAVSRRLTEVELKLAAQQSKLAEREVANAAKEERLIALEAKLVAKEEKINALEDDFEERVRGHRKAQEHLQSQAELFRAREQDLLATQHMLEERKAALRDQQNEVQREKERLRRVQDGLESGGGGGGGLASADPYASASAVSLNSSSENAAQRKRAQDLEAKEKALAAREAELVALSRNFDVMQKDLAATSRRLEEAQQNSQASQSRHLELVKQVRDKDAEIVELREALSLAKARETSAKREAEDLREHLNEQHNSSSQHDDAAGGVRLEEMQRDLDALSQENDRLAADHARLQHAHDLLLEEASGLREHCRALESKLAQTPDPEEQHEVIAFLRDQINDLQAAAAGRGSVVGGGPSAEEIEALRAANEALSLEVRELRPGGRQYAAHIAKAVLGARLDKFLASMIVGVHILRPIFTEADDKKALVYFVLAPAMGTSTDVELFRSDTVTRPHAGDAPLVWDHVKVKTPEATINFALRVVAKGKAKRVVLETIIDLQGLEPVTMEEATTFAANPAIPGGLVVLTIDGETWCPAGTRRLIQVESGRRPTRQAPKSPSQLGLPDQGVSLVQN
jgi:hypothetical protein